MPARSVGIIGHNGLVGAKIVSHLYPLQVAGKLRLVVIHRPSSSTSSIPQDVEKRTLDWSSPDGPVYDAALAGLEVVISAVASAAIHQQESLLPALARSQSLQAFLPSEFGAAWSEIELETMSAKFLGAKDAIADKARKLDIPVTIIHAGLFSDFLFTVPITVDVRSNRNKVYAASQTNPAPYTTTSYLGAALAQLVQQPTESYAGKSFSVVEYRASGEEISGILQDLHGKQPDLEHFSKERLQGELGHENGMISLGAGILRKIGEHSWPDDDDESIVVDGWQSQGIAAEIKKAFAN